METYTAARRSLVALSLTALFAALIAAGAFISFPLPFSPVPVVLQNLFAVLAGLVLGPARGSAAVALYLLAGALGLPVFAGATGGIAHFAGPTGGFLAGYFLAGLTAGLIAGRPKKSDSRLKLAAASAAAFVLIYVPGVIWLSHITGSWKTGLIAGCLPFLPGDAVKAALAVLVSERMRRLASDLLEN
ncbi:MAG: biotin transporter BioY [Treponema sp.]|jgi:biotin transport system substrate-specific component|nr:biotin transporter BioY [Treponema sp.]